MNQQTSLSDAQHKARSEGIGGSDVAAILGLSPWKSRLELYFEKIGEAPTDTERNPSEYKHWGIKLEDLIAEEYCRRHDRKVRRVNQTIVHPDYPWMRANVDRIVLNLDRLLECKTANVFMRKDWGQPGTDEVPMYYMAQVAHYLVVTRRSVGDLACLIGGQEYADYIIEWDSGIAEMLIEEEARFWHEHVLARVPPAPRTTEEAELLWPRNDPGKSVIATPEIEQAWQALKDAKKRDKESESEQEQHKLTIQKFMQDADTLLDPDGKRPLVTWRHQKQRRLDGKALQHAYPDFADSFTTEIEFRRFLAK